MYRSLKKKKKVNTIKACDSINPLDCHQKRRRSRKKAGTEKKGNKQTNKTPQSSEAYSARLGSARFGVHHQRSFV